MSYGRRARTYGTHKQAAVGGVWRLQPRACVRWFELDYPDTQADKLLRLERLRIGVAHVGFVPADLDRVEVLSPLLEGGWRPDAPSLMLCEGLALHLERAVLCSLLAGLRAHGVGSRIFPSTWPPAALDGPR